MGIAAQILEVTTAKQARDLASVVLNPQRRIPLVVVCMPSRRVTQPAAQTTTGSGVVDIDDLAATAGLRADVATITQQVVDDFNDLLPAGVRVYGDAVRIYPPASTWTTKPPHCEVIASVQDRGQGLWRIRSVLDALTPPPPGRTTPRTPTDTTTSPRWDPTQTPPADPQRADTPERVDALIALLRSPHRTHPVVVITTASDGTTCWINPTTVARDVASLAWVAIVPTGRLTFRLNDAITHPAGVYGGAGRVYPPGTDWITRPHLSRLRTAYDHPHGARVADALIGDALALATLANPATTGRTAPSTTSGVVVTTVPPTRAMVRLEDGTPAAIWADTIPGRLRIDQLVTPGQQVTGLLDTETGHLDVRGHLVDQSTWADTLRPGDVVATRVEAVDQDTLTLALAPGVQVVVGIDEVTGNPRDDLRDLASEDEVLPARVIEPTPALAVTLLDLDPDEPPTVQPPSLLPQGPPWLRADQGPDDDEQAPPVPGDTAPAAPAEPSARPDPAQTAPEQGADRPEARASSGEAAPSATSACSPAQVSPQDGDAPPRPAQALSGGDGLLEDLRAQVEALTDTVRDQQRQIARHVREIERLRAANRKARTAKKTTAARGAVPDEHGFDDPHEQVRWEVYRTWVTETLPGDKARYPLPEQWHLGPDFIDSLTVPGVARQRVLSTAVAVLTGRPPRGTHVLRISAAGNAGQLVRADGAAAWRTPLQQGTPSARRLHWWRRPDGSIELARVVVHDDMSA